VAGDRGAGESPAGRMPWGLRRDFKDLRVASPHGEVRVAGRKCDLRRGDLGTGMFNAQQGAALCKACSRGNPPRC
jgi:hypothetical protein